MAIKIVAAIGNNNELGKNNQLIWHLPKDLKFFRQLTLDKHIIMGRKTFESLPKKLDHRTNIVLSHEDLEKKYDVICYDSLEKVLMYYYINPSAPDLYVIGGESIYKQFFEYTDVMYLTHINASDLSADTYFPYFVKGCWNCTKIDSNIENGIGYSHYKYTRKRRKYFNDR